LANLEISGAHGAGSDQLLLLILHPFNSHLSRTTWISWYKKEKPLWIQMRHEMMGFSDAVAPAGPYTTMCASFQTDNYTNTSSLNFFYRPEALPDTQPTVSKH